MNVSIESLDAPAAGKNPWVERYGEFIGFLSEKYQDRFPIAQSVLRGPLDVLAAAIGDENMVYALYDHPQDVARLLKGYTRLFIEFLTIKREKAPAYFGGDVVGQYAIWTPGSAARLQQDAQTLLSARLYEEFVLPCDDELAKKSEYNLFHMHASAFHLLDVMLQVQGISMMQISKDEGVPGIDGFIGGLQRIQRAGRCLVLKGRLTPGDIDLIKTGLEYGGLCLQFVVDTAAQADETLEYARKQFE